MTILNNNLISKVSSYRVLDGVRVDRLYEQGATKLRLVKYVQLWIKWARSGVSLDIEKLKLKTIQILLKIHRHGE